jgi:hypothetical protein
MAMVLFGAFIGRYRLEMVLAFPFVALVMVVYFALAFKPESAAQHPELLHREPWLLASVLVCAAAMLAFLFIDVPALHQLFHPTVVSGR